MNIAIILAGGSGSRMGENRPKQFLELEGKPLIVYTIIHFELNPLIDSIVVACHKEWLEYMRKTIVEFNLSKVKAIVEGGASGQDSIYNGLVAAKNICDDYETSIVLIHDAVRPFITSDLISENINNTKVYGSCITCAPATETVLVQGSKNIEIPQRNMCFLARAPQTFYLKDIFLSHNRAINEGKHDFVDSCTLMKYDGHNLHLIIGPSDNIKITTPLDYILFKEKNRKL